MTDVTVLHPGPLADDGLAAGGSNLVRWFEDLSLADADRVGGKGANLGELVAAHLPVPAGFVVTTDAYLLAVEQGGVRATLRDLMAGVDRTRPHALAARAAQAREVLRTVKLPPEVHDAVLTAYRRLQDLAPGPVAVRSSAAGEDSASASFAGMNETFTNVQGTAELIDRVRGCWASIFGDRVVTYRSVRALRSEPAIAVVVQHMVTATRSGVLFTQDPSDPGSSRMVVEAAWGQGEVVVGGQVEPDTYLLDRAGDALSIGSVRVGNKAFEIVAGAAGHDERRPLSAERAAARVLDDELLLRVGALGLAAARHHGTPQDVEWCTEGDRIWLVQSRPITTLSAAAPIATAPLGAAALQPASGSRRPAALLSGLPASRGVGSGPVRILSSPQEADHFQPGEVLVAAMTTPDWLPVMRHAAAVVTDGGGITCHAAIVTRELGIPCVVGTRTATTTLRDGEVVTVDAEQGKVFLGAAAHPPEQPPLPPSSPRSIAVAGPAAATTATRVLVNLALPEEAAGAASLAVDGVGLLRAELLLTDALGGRHPRALLAEGRGEQFVDAMTDALCVFGRAFGDRPVLYRAIDLRSNEFRDLEGGDAFEPVEANPMIGYRGCYRYLREPDLFGLELDALQRARRDTANVHLMIPFVRTAWELAGVFRQIDASPLGADRRLQRWIMAEVPSVVHWLPTYAAMGVHGVSIGSNDLTQLVLGVDRDSAVLADLFDESDPAVLATISQIVSGAHRAGMQASLCGQAPSRNPTFASHLVRFGIDSVSVDPSSVGAVQRHIAAAEQRLLLEAARRPGPGADR